MENSQTRLIRVARTSTFGCFLHRHFGEELSLPHQLMQQRAWSTNGARCLVGWMTLRRAICR